MAEKVFTVSPIYRGFNSSIVINFEAAFYAASLLDAASAGTITAAMVNDYGDDPLFTATTADGSITRDETDAANPFLTITIPQASTALFEECNIKFGFIVEIAGEATVVDGLVEWPVSEPPAANPTV